MYNSFIKQNLQQIVDSITCYITDVNQAKGGSANYEVAVAKFFLFQFNN